jgi:hypothetical protein
MFDDEYIVLIDALDDKGQQMEAVSFANKDDLKTEAFPTSSDPVDGWLSVSPMQIGKEQARVVLPKPTMANGPIVLVPTSSLAEQ